MNFLCSAKSSCAFLILFLSVISSVSVYSQTKVFTHPGGNESLPQLLFVKQQIAAQKEPWFSQYNAMVNLAAALPTAGVPALPNENGQRDIAKSAYANALAYWYSGNSRYADQAVAILKAWGSVTPYSTADVQSKLVGAWIGSLLGPAAELVRGYMTNTDRTAVANMFKSVFYNSLQSPSGWNGNVELTQIDAAFNIAVFCEDEALFDYAVNRFGIRVPASIYLTSDGPTAISLPGASWYSPNYISPNVNGLMQESCRDFDHHAQFAFAALVSAAEVAYHQGVDLYKQYQTRIVGAMELLAKQIATGSMQGVCTNGDVTTTGIYNTIEIGYNHYHNIKGLTLAQTASVLPKIQQGSSDWNIFYETLTHHGAGDKALVKCPKPNLGDNLSICGNVDLVLNSSLSNSTNKIFTWYKDKIQVQGQTGTTLVVNSAGTYRLQVDSADACSWSDSVVVNGGLVVNLGPNKELCNPATDTLDAGNSSVTAANYLWNTGATSQRIIVNKGGTYSVTVSAKGCASVSDTITISSKLLTVTSDTLCAPGQARLTVLGTNPYGWYNTPSGGIALDTTFIYKPFVTATQTFYVEDLGGINTSIGKTSQGTGQVWTVGLTDFPSNDKQYQMSVLKTLTLKSVVVYVVNNGTSVTINFSQGGIVKHTATVSGLSSGKQTINLGFTLTPGNYLIDAVGTSNQLYYESSGAAFPYAYNGYLSYTYNQPWQSGWYGLFYDWKVVVGNACARTLVEAVVNPQDKKCAANGLEEEFVEEQFAIYPVPANEYVTVRSMFFNEPNEYIKIMNSEGVTTKQLTAPSTGKEITIDLKELKNGLYFVKIGNHIQKLIVEK